MGQNKELIEKLKNLLSVLQEYDAAKQEKELADSWLNSDRLQTHNLENFDDSHLEEFVEEKIGKEPVAPGGLIVLALPVYLVQKAQYDSAIANYKKMRPLAEAAYREAYHDQREELKKKDQEEYEKNLDEAKKRVSLAEKRLKKAKDAYAAEDTVSESLKKTEIIEKIVLYLEEGRADDMKEAVNLYYEEQRKDEEARKADEHRKKIIELEEEQVRAAQAAEEYAAMQYEEAQQAKMYAMEAADAARDAANDAASAVDAANNAQYLYIDNSDE